MKIAGSSKGTELSDERESKDVNKNGSNENGINEKKEERDSKENELRQEEVGFKVVLSI